MNGQLPLPTAENGANLFREWTMRRRGLTCGVKGVALRRLPSRAPPTTSGAKPWSAGCSTMPRSAQTTFGLCLQSVGSKGRRGRILGSFSGEGAEIFLKSASGFWLRPLPVVTAVPTQQLLLGVPGFPSRSRA